MNPNARPCPHPDILYWEDPDHSAAILALPQGPDKLLNATGRLVWNLCDGRRTCQDILQALKSHFDDIEESTLAHDLNQFICDQVAHGFLQLST